MIETYFGTDTLDSLSALVAAGGIGLLFGVILEQAGFGSSRRLAGIFYFTDMTVLKVMFSALITAMLGLNGAQALGLIAPDQLYFLPTVYGAHIIGGLIFGVGFAMGGWCPGTAAVGFASGKLDALVFLVGALLGSILFNELFEVLQPLYTWGQTDVVFIYQTLGMSLGGFALLLTLLAVICFWVVEFLGPATGEPDRRVLTVFSLTAMGLAGGLLLASQSPVRPISVADQEKALLAQVEAARDHIEPEELADLLLKGNPHILVVDIRPGEEYESFYIRGAINVPLPDLAEALTPHREKDLIVLYSNGMTHPAQARDSLYRQGYRNVYILSDGLQGFIERVLKPVSLRREPLPPAAAAQVKAWRAYFGSPDKAPGPP